MAQRQTKTMRNEDKPRQRQRNKNAKTGAASGRQQVLANVVPSDNQWMHSRRKKGEQMCELTHEQTLGHAKILVMQIFPTNYGGVGGWAGHGHGQSGRQYAYVDTVGVSEMALEVSC